MGFFQNPKIVTDIKVNKSSETVSLVTVSSMNPYTEKTAKITATGDVTNVNKKLVMSDLSNSTCYTKYDATGLRELWNQLCCLS
jgi:hypothetical protein